MGRGYRTEWDFFLRRCRILELVALIGWHWSIPNITELCAIKWHMYSVSKTKYFFFFETEYLVA